MIKRDGKYIRPGGSTIIEVNDTITILADKEKDFSKVKDRLTKNLLLHK